jgi:hypothetical protein
LNKKKKKSNGLLPWKCTVVTCSSETGAEMFLIRSGDWGQVSGQVVWHRFIYCSLDGASHLDPPTIYLYGFRSLPSLNSSLFLTSIVLFVQNISDYNG